MAEQAGGARGQAGRRAFAEKYAAKPASFWENGVDAYIDNKFFPTFLNHRARAYAAKRVARGTFRARGGGLGRGHVKPKKTLKVSFSHGSIQIAAAICAEKVLMWHKVEGPWNAEAATHMYRRVLAPALRAQRPGKRQFLILEDNDPSGYKSKRAIEAKRAEGIKIMDFPKRSPDMNPLDYGLWAEISKRMRRQERSFSPSMTETLEQYVARLRRTAMRLPPKFLSAVVRSMKRRCAALREAGGLDFEE